MLPTASVSSGETSASEIAAVAPMPAAPQLIAALLASAHRALPPGAREAGWYIAQASQLLLAPAAGAAAAREARPSPLTPGQIDRIDRWIEARLGEVIQIEQLAALVNLSRSRFFRAFQGTVGETP